MVHEDINVFHLERVIKEETWVVKEFLIFAITKYSEMNIKKLLNFVTKFHSIFVCF